MPHKRPKFLMRIGGTIGKWLLKGLSRFESWRAAAADFWVNPKLSIVQVAVCGLSLHGSPLPLTVSSLGVGSRGIISGTGPIPPDPLIACGSRLSSAGRALGAQLRHPRFDSRS